MPLVTGDTLRTAVSGADRAVIDVSEPDLRDLSPVMAATCDALALSLAEGDLPAAQRLYTYVTDLVSDRRLALTAVLRPLLATDIAEPAARDVFLDSGRRLLRGLRRPTPEGDGPPVTLCATDADCEPVELLLLALLLDDAHVSVTLAAAEAGAASAAGAVCLHTPDTASLTRWDDAVRTLRTRRKAVVLFGEGCRSVVAAGRRAGASAAAWRLGEAADILLHLRGPLTRAEAQVLRMAADGYTNQRVAHELGISVSAVKARLEASYAKLGAVDRTHAVAIALRHRWIR